MTCDWEPILSIPSEDHFLSLGLKKLAAPQNCLVVIHAHILPTFIPLLKRLSAIGFRQKNIFIIGKPYSTVPHVQDEIIRLGFSQHQSGYSFDPGEYDAFSDTLLSRAAKRISEQLSTQRFERVILVDDGGELSRYWRKLNPIEKTKVVSIQQTRSGFHAVDSFRNFSIIDVARSYAKRKFESPAIRDGIMKAIDARGVLSGNERVGIIGVGEIGSRIASLLLSRKKRVVIFDNQESATSNFKGENKSVVVATDAYKLMQSSDIIFGCTGKSSLPGYAYSLDDNSKVFVSVSSRDVEFRSLLTNQQFTAKHMSEGDQYGDVSVYNKKRDIHHKVLNGGFPINFDRASEYESQRYISITRALILAAVVQALYTPTGSSETLFPRVFKLAPRLQHKIVSRWLGVVKERPKDYLRPALVDKFNAIQMWQKESGGTLDLEPSSAKFWS